MTSKAVEPLKLIHAPRSIGRRRPRRTWDVGRMQARRVDPAKIQVTSADVGIDEAKADWARGPE